MAKELPDRLKGAKTLSDGKVQLRDGTIMSRSAYMSQRSSTRPPVVRIASSGSTPKPRVSAREAERQAKRGRAEIKKGNKTDPFTNNGKMTKRDLTPTKTTARMAAAERAKAIPASERTSAQTRAIKTASRAKSVQEWNMIDKQARAEAAATKKSGKSSRGRGGMGGGGFFGGSPLRKSR